MNRLDEEIQKFLNESNSEGDRILFSSFGGSIEPYGDVFPYGKDVMQIRLGSASRVAKQVFEKPIEISHTNGDKNSGETEFEAEFKAEYNRAKAENKNDIIEILKELKPLCDEFDQKIETILANKGYKKV